MSGTPTFPPPVNPSDLGKGPMIIGTTWMLTSISVIVVAFRFYVRTRKPNRPMLDDWFMLAAVVFQLVAQSLVTRAYHYGLGKHDADLWFEPQLVNILKYTWLQLPFGVMVAILARISITILLTRIFKHVAWFKLYLICFTTLQSIGGIMVIITVFAEVTPAKALWNPLLPAKRWDPRIQLYTAYTAGALFAFGDLTYGLFSVWIVWKLQMPLKKKIGLAFILALSIFTCVAATMKVVVAQQASGLATDVQYHTVQALPWTYSEQCLVIILGSAPVFAFRIMSLSLGLTSFKKLASSIKDWSKRSFGGTSHATESTGSDFKSNLEKGSFESRGQYSNNSSKQLLPETDASNNTITRTDEYNVAHMPR